MTLMGPLAPASRSHPLAALTPGPVGVQPAAAPAPTAATPPAVPTGDVAATNLATPVPAAPATSIEPTAPPSMPRDPSLLVKLTQQTDLAPFAALPRGGARKQAVYDALAGTAQASQHDLVALADKLQVSGDVSRVRSMYSPNMLVVTPVAGHEAGVLAAFQAAQGVDELFRGADGSKIYPGQHFDDLRLFPWEHPSGPDDPNGASSVTAAPATPARPAAPADGDVPTHTNLATGLVPVPRPEGTTWDVKAIGAPEAWKQGADGHGLVYGAIDTGSDGQHPALHDSYRGTVTGSDDHNWMDFIGSSPTPIDYRKHGSHVLGSVVGHEGTTRTGVAPGATWISAPALAPGGGSVEPYLDAMQWMLAPTKRDGTDPEPKFAPDVVGASWWAAPPDEDLFHESVANLVGAGIEFVKSAGNDGPAAMSGTSPGQFAETITVGSTDTSGNVATDSSRGPSPLPVPAGGTAIPKPDIVAPGVDIVSTIPGGGSGYGRMGGTSMAQPHASGAVLDILSKYPQLTHEQLVQVLQTGAHDLGAPGIDADSGAGLIDIPASLAAARKLLGKPTNGTGGGED